MTVLKPRSRIISVRLSEEEYAALRKRCDVTSARSVSDLTRDAMKAILTGSSRDKSLAAWIEEFSTQMRKIDQRMERIERLAAELMKYQESETNGS